MRLSHESAGYREIIVKGTVGQLEALIEFERISRENRGRDQISKMIPLRFHGPVKSGQSEGNRSLYWMIDNGAHIVLDMLKIGRGSGAGGPWGYLALGPNMSYEDMDREAKKLGVSLPEVLGLGVLRVAELPDNRLRIVFDMGGYDSPDFFWQWTESFVEELERQGFIESPKAEEHLLELQRFKYLTERQTYRDIYVEGRPQENIARALLQTFLTSRNYREVPVRGGQTDILSFARQGRFLYETKIWRGAEYYRQGLKELEEYITGEHDDQALKGVFYVVFDPTESGSAQEHLGGDFKTEKVKNLDLEVVVVNIALPRPSKKR